MFDYLVLALLWVGYCAVHSTLISISVTNRLRSALGRRYRFYRLFFNAFSLLALIPLIAYSHSSRFSSAPVFAWSGLWLVPRYSLIALAAVLVIAGARHYSMMQFLGIQQIRNQSARGAMTAGGDLDASGILGVVRHPWYVAVFLLLWTSDLNWPTITVNLVLSAYLIVGTLLEERKLVIEFGDRYRRYQERVSMFVPLKWLNSDRARRAASTDGIR